MNEEVPKYRILVVEDDPDVRMLITLHLKKEGHEVLTASTGPEGLRAARKEKVDLVILDIGLPDIDGLKVCQTLRSEKNKVPVLILTARMDKSSHEQAVSVGADDFLVKPFKGRQLMKAIEDLDLENRAVASKKRFGIF